MLVAAKANQEPDEKDRLTEQPSYLTRDAGSPGASRWRVTLCARQSVAGYFDPDQTPKGARKLITNLCAPPIRNNCATNHEFSELLGGLLC